MNEGGAFIGFRRMRRDFFGGTWCQNTYPGAAVDVPSPLYSLSFAPYRWSQMFAEQAELDARLAEAKVLTLKSEEKLDLLNTRITRLRKQVGDAQ